MSVILAFEQRPQKPQSKKQTRAAGQVVMFTGVRYERIPEVSVSIVKTAKKTRKTA